MVVVVVGKIRGSILSSLNLGKISRSSLIFIGLQICIKWGLQHGTSVIPKGTGEEHIVGNLDVLDWELSSEDYEVRVCTSPCLSVCMLMLRRR